MNQIIFRNSHLEVLTDPEVEEAFLEEKKLLGDHALKVEFLCENGRLKLISDYGSPVYIDIEANLRYHKKTFHKTALKTQPLARALGILKQKNLHVFDATAGLLSDALLIYAMGAKLSAFERNPLVQALITNALKLYPLEDFQFFPKNIIEHTDFLDCDVIYFDPMYQESNQKSLPKKEMQVFREFIGKDSDAREVFLFLKTLKKRIVMKRSLKASPLFPPDFTSSGKSTAYDVFLPL